jgi:thymidylate synthase/dihydrofolate reductase
MNIIIATDSEYGIASSQISGMPWPYFKKDMDRFKSLTMSTQSTNIILMGRKTADTFKKPLPGRLNIVLTSQTDYRKSEGFISTPSYLDFLEYINLHHKNTNMYAIGGAELLKEVVKYPNYIHKIYLTYITKYEHKHEHKYLTYITKYEHEHKHEIDIRLPKSLIDLMSQSAYIMEEFDGDFTGEFRTYDVYGRSRVSKEEQQYLNQLSELTKCVKPRNTRNGNVYSVFSRQLVFDLSKGFPALTTKKLFWKGVVEELLFFLQGKTQTKELSEKGVTIWNGNTSQEFLDKMGFDYEEGEMGPMYGYIWRFAGSTSFDQLKMVLDLLLTDPMSRRIMMTTYDPSIANKGVLYPCHGIITQFYVRESEDIYVVDCKTYQRSADWFLGVPFNIASYALLLHLIVNHLNRISKIKYMVGVLYMDFGDVHLYESHMQPALTQLGQYGSELPTLEFNKDIDLLNPEFYKTVTFEDFKLINYKSGKLIRAAFIP